MGQALFYFAFNTNLYCARGFFFIIITHSWNDSKSIDYISIKSKVIFL